MTFLTGKETFASPQQAWRAVTMLQSKANHSSKHRSRITWAKGRLEGYKCPVCKLWHAGHGIVRED